MASLHQDKRTGNWILAFRWADRQHRRSCETARNGEAQGIKARVEDTIRLLKQGRIEIPKGADPSIWIMSDGKLESKPTNNGNGPVAVGSVCAAYYKD